MNFGQSGTYLNYNDCYNSARNLLPQGSIMKNDKQERHPGIPPANVVLYTFIAGVITTAIHYLHNFNYPEHYPPVYPFFPNALSYQIGIAVFFPICTILGIHGVIQYCKGNFRRAFWPLMYWVPLGLTSPGHFLGGVPDIPAYAMFTITTDFATALMILVFMLQMRANLDHKNRNTPSA